MTCPGCQIEFNAQHWGECPHCGHRENLNPPTETILKTSSILISTDDGGIFDSIEQVPEKLRKTLVACTTGANSGTIFIADRRGRERIASALNTAPKAAAPAAPVLRGRWPVLLLAALLAAGFSGVLVWFAISHLK